MDFVIRGASVFDGTGGGALVADVHVVDGAIVEIGGRLDGTHVVDAVGLALSPGFIDTHTHDDWAVFGDQAPKVTQGVTTVVTGNCGVSIAPYTPAGPLPDLFNEFPERAFGYPTFGSYVEGLASIGSPTNVVPLVGHATLRLTTMSESDRPATAAEAAAMRDLLAAALDEGAAGWSTGLEYSPARRSDLAELTTIARASEGREALYSSHMRDEADGVVTAMDEFLAVGAVGAASAVMSHHKCSGTENFGRSVETLAHFDQHAPTTAALDVYPYDACSTILHPMFVANARRTLITSSKSVHGVAGRDLDELAAEWALDRRAAIERLSPAGAVYFDMDDADVRRILQHPLAMIGSDGLPGDEHPHPRLWGTFARVLGHYARDVGLFPLAEAIRKMTSLPAQRFGLPRRGRIAPGCVADLVLFDPANVTDTATFERPVSAASGFDSVWVGGIRTLADGRLTGARPGGPLRQRFH